MDQELDRLQDAVERRRGEGGTWTLSQVWFGAGRLRLLLVLVVILNAGQQLTGINAVSALRSSRLGLRLGSVS